MPPLANELGGVACNALHEEQNMDEGELCLQRPSFMRELPFSLLGANGNSRFLVGSPIRAIGWFTYLQMMVNSALAGRSYHARPAKSVPLFRNFGKAEDMV